MISPLRSIGFAGSISIYSQTCIKRSVFGQSKNDFLRQVNS